MKKANLANREFSPENRRKSRQIAIVKRVNLLEWLRHLFV